MNYHHHRNHHYLHYSKFHHPHIHHDEYFLVFQFYPILFDDQVQIINEVLYQHIL